MSVVPLKLVTGLVPTFPVSPHPPLAATCQVALPKASEVRTYPDVGFVERRRPVNAPVQATVSKYPGVFVPIPTSPVEETLILLFPSPSAIIILLERFDARPVTLAPRIVLAEPVIIHCAVPYQIAVLLLPVETLRRASAPYEVL